MIVLSNHNMKKQFRIMKKRRIMIKKFESYLRINKIISILREVDEAKLLNVVQALYAGGIRILEIAFASRIPPRL